MRRIESPILPFKLERYFARWEFAAPYLLCTSDIQGIPMQQLLALADLETKGLWENLALGYTETAGHPVLHEEIANLYAGIRAEQVLTFSGAEEALYIALRVLLRPGDHVIATFPGYQSSYEVARACGADVTEWRLRVERQSNRSDWHLDIDDLRKSLRPNTRMVLVNFPNNPTGALPAPADWHELLDVVREAGCYLFSDEVYRLMEYNPADRLSAAVEEYDKAVSLGVMSKPFGLAGLRIGWAACHDRDLLTQMAVYKDYTTICSSAPSEILSIIALRSKDALLERSLEMIHANLELVEALMAEWSQYFEWLPPRASSICFPRWTGKGTIAQFCERLVEKEGVLLLPGDVYDFPGGHFRLGLGRENSPEALLRLDRFLRSL
jgi:aspartate/methionine/tyrosine aminotransferase